jgi:hypothetical protein
MGDDLPGTSRSVGTETSREAGATVAPLTPDLKEQMKALTPALAKGVTDVQKRK